MYYNTAGIQMCIMSTGTDLAINHKIDLAINHKIIGIGRK